MPLLFINTTLARDDTSPILYVLPGTNTTLVTNDILRNSTIINHIPKSHRCIHRKENHFVYEYPRSRLSSPRNVAGTANSPA